MHLRQQLGRRGEQIARAFLVEKGYKILAQNYYSRDGEIDIVAKQDNKIIFVEVKTRRSNQFGGGEEAVDDNKIEKLKMTAQKYIQESQLENVKWQIDLVVVEFNQKKPVIRHIENISF